MRQGSYRDIVNAAFAIGAQRVNGNTTAGLGLYPAVDDFYGLAGILDREVVKHHTVNATVIQHLL